MSASRFAFWILLLISPLVTVYCLTHPHLFLLWIFGYIPLMLWLGNRD